MRKGIKNVWKVLFNRLFSKSMIKNILITGIPGCGKTSLLSKIIDKVGKKKGFFTKEIRRDGARIGFEVIGSGGEQCVLANVNFKSDYKVSKYFVDLKSFEKILDEFFNYSDKELLYIDEIGEMELFSNKFKELAMKYLESENSFIATISEVYKDDFTTKIKNRKDVHIINLNKENREEKYAEIISMLSRLGVKVKYISC